VRFTLLRACRPIFVEDLAMAPAVRRLGPIRRRNEASPAA
jgi:hypothetical protein